MSNDGMCVDGDRSFEVRGVDAPASHAHARLCAAQPRHEHMLATIDPDVFAHAEEAHPARRQQRLVEHAAEVIANLAGARTRVQPGVRTRRVDHVGPEPAGVHAVERRGLMESNERVGVVPMSARAVAPIDHHDIGVGVGDQLVGERHAGCAGTDHEVVRLDHRQPTQT
jgi:hypothetical protein